MEVLCILFFLVVPVWIISDIRNNEKKQEYEEYIINDNETEIEETVSYSEEQDNDSELNSIDYLNKNLPVSDDEVGIEEVDEIVYATMNVNIREEHNDASTIVGMLVGGDSIKRTGICENGWSMVLYGNEEHYIHSEYLTTLKPELEKYNSNNKNGWEYLGEFKITAYCGGSCCNGKWAGITSTGVSPKTGRTIAVAPWIIPYGSEVMIEGLDNIYIAEDTGGFANRNSYQIDLFVSSHSSANEWGVQYRKVWIKK